MPSSPALAHVLASPRPVHRRADVCRFGAAPRGFLVHSSLSHPCLTGVYGKPQRAPAPPPPLGGGFTNVDPESRRVVPEANGRTKLKVGLPASRRCRAAAGPGTLLPGEGLQLVSTMLCHSCSPPRSACANRNHACPLCQDTRRGRSDALPRSRPAPTLPAGCVRGAGGAVPGQPERGGQQDQHPPQGGGRAHWRRHPPRLSPAVGALRTTQPRRQRRHFQQGSGP